MRLYDEKKPRAAAKPPTIILNRFMDIHSPFFGRFAIDITIQGMNRNDRIPDSFKTLNEAESYLESAGFVKVD